MTCFHPQQGYRGRGGQFVLAKKDSPTGAPITVACGRCQGCRTARAESWAVRISHEASLHTKNVFLTLTYDDNYLPDDYSISIREIQLFLKKLRKNLQSKYEKGVIPRCDTKIRYFAVGEYGDKNGRPHYHLILFNYSPDDLQISRQTKQGHYCYTSREISKIWPYGLHEIGSVTKQSAGYVARYSFKKIGGTFAADHYKRLHPLTGEIVDVHPEFATMSTHPGIGLGWFKKYEGDVFPHDFVILDGRKAPVPEYYKKQLRGRSLSDGLLERDDFYEIGQKRRSGARARADDRTPERLAIREESAGLRVKRLAREI